MLCGAYAHDFSCSIHCIEHAYCLQNVKLKWTRVHTAKLSLFYMYSLYMYAVNVNNNLDVLPCMYMYITCTIYVQVLTF